MATVELKLKPWVVPNFAVVDEPARPKQDGLREAMSIPVADLSEEALSSLAREWLTDLYKKAGKPHDWAFHAARSKGEA